jgi:hypothetical protein
MTFPREMQQFSKRAFINSHGYFYLGSVDGAKKAWLCSVKDCQNTTIEG